MRIEDEGGKSLSVVRFRLWRGEAASLAHDVKEAVDVILDRVDKESLRSGHGYSLTLEIRSDGRLAASAEHDANL